MHPNRRDLELLESTGLDGDTDNVRLWSLFTFDLNVRLEVEHLAIGRQRHRPNDAWKF